MPLFAAPKNGGDGKQSINYYPIHCSIATPVRMIVKGADGKALPNAMVKIQNEAGQTVATVKADANGLVSWTPTQPGRLFLHCASGQHIPDAR